jgi:capsid protein
MIAGSSDPLFDDWSTNLREPNRHVACNVKLVAARAASLVEDWDIAAGMVRARLLGTHGPRGLRFNSLFQRDDEPDTDDAERTTRRQIMAAITGRNHRFDAGDAMTRRKFNRAIDWMAIVLGNGWAVRVRQRDGHRWRLIHPFRVRNPKGKTNGEQFQDGIELDDEGRRVAVWIDPARQTELGWDSAAPIRIPWRAPDGTPNVAHRKGYDIPGALHGLSFFAPLMLPARMLQGVAEAYVAAKRVQASIPLLMEVEDVEKARQSYQGTRLANLVMPKGSSVTFPSWKFDGADFREFDDTQIRDVCSAWGIPWELVLGDHSAKSGASSRSLWQQFYQQAEDWQVDNAEEFCRPVDESIVREEQVAGNVDGLTDDWDRNMAGAYQGPPRIMPDPSKEADAAGKWIELGRSETSTFADQGWDFRDETMQASQDEDMKNAQAAGLTKAKQEADAAFVDRVKAADEKVQSAKVDGLSWPIVIAAAGADSAPGAFLGALSKQSEPAQPAAPTVDNPNHGSDDQRTEPSQRITPIQEDDMRASDVVKIVQAMTARESQPVQIIQRMEVGADSAKILGEAIAANMPQQMGPTINVAPAAVTVEAARIEIPPAQVTVNVPQQATPVVMATSSAPAVHVHIPEQKPRKQRAVEQKDGSIILEDIQ